MTNQITRLDGRIVGVDCHGDSPDAWPHHVCVLAVAMHAAARAAHLAAASAAGDLPSRKREIDGEATRAAELVFDAAGLRIDVAAGEGPGDRMPGAFEGQRLGDLDPGQRPAEWMGIFDYVDGTTLTAAGLPGALSLGGIGRGLASVPDLQAYAILAKTSRCPDFDMLAEPEAHAARALAILANDAGKPLREMIVLTHSEDTGPFHRELIQRLVNEGPAAVIVPDPVIIEPPYILSLVGMSRPRIDTMIGVFGFPELAFAALLLDLVAPEYGFAFRPASLDGGVDSKAGTLAPLFVFSPGERATLRSLGWDADEQYVSHDMVPEGGAEAACIFAVTDNDLLKLNGPRARDGVLETEGVVVYRGQGPVRVTISSTLPPLSRPQT